MSLYQKVRPGTLEEIVGNKRTIKAIAKMVKSEGEDRPHAILMQGSSGCGKTTVARIIAKEFGSDESSIFESNAANTRGIDDIREIARTAPLSVLGNKPKTYIIDESHQLTKPAQQALLKVLEDSPERCYFILCTTDPQNLIPTIRNRCVDYTMGKLKVPDLLELLNNTCAKANLDVPDEIIQVVAATSSGSPRATIVALEKVKDITDVDTAIELLMKGTEYDVNIIDICKMLNAEQGVRLKNASKIIFLASKLDSPPEQLRNSIMTYLSKMAVSCPAGNYEELSDLNYVMSTMDSRYYISKATLINLLLTVCVVPNPNLTK
jgi:DNA polymerase III gamma/tau subunit